MAPVQRQTDHSHALLYITSSEEMIQNLVIIAESDVKDVLCKPTVQESSHVADVQKRSERAGNAVNDVTTNVNLSLIELNCFIFYIKNE